MDLKASRLAGLPNVVILLAGVWLLVAWLFLDYGDAPQALAVHLTAGVTLAGLAGFSLVERPVRGTAAVTASVGILVAVAPVIVPFGRVDLVLASAASGLIVLVAAVLSARTGNESRNVPALGSRRR